tara:strand:- start:4565 stop:4972 length:408 start_codon:yes stop_codon:yes gene_type:complete
MDLTVNQIIATFLSSVIILKILILILLPNSYYKRLIQVYNNINILDIIYYVYIVFGCIMLFYIYSIFNLSLTDMLVVGFAFSMIIGAGMLKLFGNEFSNSLKKYNGFIDLFKQIWLYILLWLFYSIMTLKEIFFS